MRVAKFHCREIEAKSRGGKVDFALVSWREKTSSRADQKDVAPVAGPTPLETDPIDRPIRPA